MSAPAIDRDRLLADLRAAAHDAGFAMPAKDWSRSRDLRVMGRAWLIVAAAVEDGEYDAAPVTAHKPWCRTWTEYDSCNCRPGTLLEGGS